MQDKSGRPVNHFFDALAGEYTESIERCFPRYREMLWAIIDYLPYTEALESPSANILELGAGTGNLSVVAADRFPNASFSLVDVSGQSLDVCRKRLATAKAEFHEQDFRDLEFSAGEFDLVISCISIHHLESEAKKELFAKIFRWLTPGGTLAFADQNSGETAELYQRHIQNWKRDSLDAGSTDEEFQMWMDHQAEHDYHETLHNQSQWLRETGFSQVDCVWRYLLWTVTQARKNG